ncbi:CubicO group peptidase, beta-lactamase class C family [Blastococcus aggregatus]|uniref:CubicO group peptidase, beta-lactamase class C family n=1 Tax=Blastococcus aggregatus TaxID=38502 RepID=A0A285UZI9_9ACTN|nr:serine hydrolase domain-containing protein [Blastococcus aggregatus]SOC47262.1 CubicO group peptidase, beta-lactamase class C family [Blastococcus aggregatus]
MISSRTRLRSTAGVLALLASLTAGCSSDDAAGAGDPSASGATSTAPAREYDFSAVAPIVEAFLAENGLDGAGLVIVDEDEGIIDEQYFGEFDADRVSLVASASKMVTAGVLVRLADQGLLDLDEPIAEYVEWAEGANPGITVAQLLSNSSGLVGLLPNPAYGPYVCQFLPAEELEDCAATAWATPGDDADIVPPDTEFRYGGVQWQIAGAVAETVSGKPWSQLLEETYVEPCGVESLGYNNHWTQIGEGLSGYPDEFGGDPGLLAPTENPHMEGGLYIDPVDYAELLLMQLRDGRCGDTQVLEPESVERMHTDRVGETYAGATMTGTGYGFGWWIDRDGSSRITDPGAYGAVPWLDLDGGFGGYLVLEADARLGATLAAQLYEPVEAAITAAR